MKNMFQSLHAAISFQCSSSSSVDTDSAAKKRRCNTYDAPFMQQSTSARDKNKAHSCFYCGHLQCKLKRHLLSQHSYEQRVAEMAGLQNNEQKNRIFEEIRARGDFKHNLRVISGKSTEQFIVKRGPRNPDYRDYLPCRHCLTFYSKTELWRHDCILKESELNEAVGKRLVRDSRMFLEELLDVANKKLESHDFQNDLVHQFFARMRDDAIRRAAKNDALIVCLAKRLLVNKGLREYSYIAERVRRIAELFLTLRGDSHCSSISDFLKAEHYDKVVSAVRQLCGFQLRQEETVIRCPGKALKYGNDVNKLTALQHGILLKNGGGNERKLEELKNFCKIMRWHFNEDVTKLALENMQLKKSKKTPNLPDTSDVVNLYSFVEASINKVLETESLQLSDYSNLVNLVMTKIIVFNRKRVGDIQNLTKKEYLEWVENSNKQVDHETLMELDELEQHISKR